MKEEKIIMYDSEEAASQKTLTGWVSANGRYWGKDEHMARYDGCTHKKCECGNATEKSWIRCEECRHKSDVERFNKLPFKEWDESENVCTWDGDKYFFHVDDVIEYMEENDLKEIDLLICEPIEYSLIDFEQITGSEVHEDWEPEVELEKAVNKLNKVIKELKPHSWQPGKIRTNYKI